MKALTRTRCFGCPAEIWCVCKGLLTRFCPMHTPARYGELCRSCYLGVLACVSGLETAPVGAEELVTRDNPNWRGSIVPTPGLKTAEAV